MVYRSNEVKSGALILIGLFLFVGVLLVITGLDSWKDMQSYRVRFSYAGGIESGSMVRFAGLKVGRVQEVRLVDGDSAGVELVLELQAGTPVRTDSRARLTTIGVMGSYYVEISPGSPDAPLLPPGSVIPGKDVPGLAQLAGPSAEVMNELTELLRRMNDVLNPENRTHLSELLRSLNQLTQKNSRGFSDLIDNLNNLTVHLNETVKRADQILADNDTLLHQNLIQLDSVLTRGVKVADQSRRLIELMDNTVRDHDDEIHDTLIQLEAATRHLETLSRSLKERPWQLIRKDYPPERKLDP